MHYLIGDLQGCDDAFGRLLAEIGFSPSRDRITVLGDLVNRGPQSLAVLRRMRGFGNAADALLGNHDLHLLAVAQGVRPEHASDTLREILEAPDRAAWLDWLRQRPLALMCEGWLCVHAGVAPAWSTAQTLALAAEVGQMLGGPELDAFLPLMYGNKPARWTEALQGAERWRHVINVLTRIRFVDADGRLDFKVKEGAGNAPPGLLPWFEHPRRASADTPIAFGHWSTLGLVNRPDLLGIDTGCVWGGALTAVRVDGGRRDVVQVPCAAAQQPG
ncbi:MAG: symmetrical bis(5'-nucleosyl)-tetraphosphatase [Pseudomonadota bacterium]